MNGRVIGRQPRMEVTLALPNQVHLAIEFVVDTGFDGFLILPVAAVAALGLPFLHHLDAHLADDRRRRTAIHAAIIVWDGQERNVEVLAMGQRALLGTLLLDAHLLTIPFRDGDALTVDPL